MFCYRKGARPRPFSHPIRWGVVAFVLVLLGGACGSSGSKEAAPTSLAVTATEYKFSGPASVAGGVVRFRAHNDGKKKHEFSLLRVGATPVQEALNDFAKVTEGGPVPAYMGADGGVSKLKAGDSATSTLQLVPGRYLIVCALTDADSRDDAAVSDDSSASPPHFTLGMAKELTVRPAPSTKRPAATLPTEPDSITAKEYSFDIKGLHGGRHTLSFANAGPVQLHHVVILEFAGLNTPAAVEDNWKKLAAAGEGSPPPGTVAPKEVASSQPFDPGLGGTFDATLQSGHTYGFACFLTDRSGGPPHALAKGMFTAVTVP